jgi:hypothetical protein
LQVKLDVETRVRAYFGMTEGCVHRIWGFYGLFSDDGLENQRPHTDFLPSKVRAKLLIVANTFGGRAVQMHARFVPVTV